jgi:Skp family chaperone for outer membrane proteins
MSLFESKQNKAQRAYEKRQNELMGPIVHDVYEELREYARTRGFSVVLDTSKFAESVMLINESVDITSAFIAEYNQHNPLQAASASSSK